MDLWRIRHRSLSVCPRFDDPSTVTPLEITEKFVGLFGRNLSVASLA